MKWLVAWVMIAAAAVLAQADATPPPFAAQLTEMLHRSGHSPTTEEIRAVESEAGLSDPAVAKEMVPMLKKALAEPDGAVRKYALAMLVGMQTLPDPPAAAPVIEGAPAPVKKAKDAVAPVNLLALYKGGVGGALAAVIPGVGGRLTEEDPESRMLAATVLGGFSPDPPAAVYAPLLGYLKRDDAVGAVGVAVVTDLLQIGPVSEDTAAAIGRYLRRSDQSSSDRTELVEAIASGRSQNQGVNKALLGYLDSDDASLRARVILSLPELDLAADVFAETKARVATLASGGQDSLPVVNAAKAVAPCWTEVKMTSGCPVY